MNTKVTITGMICITVLVLVGIYYTQIRWERTRPGLHLQYHRHELFISNDASIDFDTATDEEKKEISIAVEGLGK